MIRKIEIVLLDDSPSGLRYFDVSGHLLIAYVVPRASIREFVKRKDSHNSGIYLLYGNTPDDILPTMYVGKTNDLSQRSIDHSMEDYWEEAILISTKDNSLKPTEIAYLEHELIKEIQNSNLVNCKNKRQEEKNTISEGDKFIMDEFIDIIKSLLTVMGKKLFEPKTKGGVFLYCSAKELNIRATAQYTDSGMVVLSGSIARKGHTGNYDLHLPKLKEKLIQSGVLKEIDGRLEFVQDYLFNSPSAASGFVLGRSSNGRLDWKTEDGKTLKEIQENPK